MENLNIEKNILPLWLSNSTGYVKVHTVDYKVLQSAWPEKIAKCL